MLHPPAAVPAPLIIGTIASTEIAERRALRPGQRLQRSLELEVDGVVIQPVRTALAEAVAINARQAGPCVVDRMCIAADEVVRGHELEARGVGLAQQPPLVESLAVIDAPVLDAVRTDEALVRQVDDLLPCHGLGSAGGGGRSVVQAETATPGMARRYRQISRAWLDSTGGSADQYLPSNAKIGLRCFHVPAVKSGNSRVWKPLAIDCSDSGVIALQVTAS